MSILQMSISAGILIITIIVIRSLGLNELPKPMFLVLWGAATIRLLLPFNLSSSFSIYSIIGTIMAHVTPKAPASDVVSTLPLDHYTAGIPQITPTVQGSIFPIAPTTIIWLAGLAAMIVFFAVIYFKNCKELKEAIPIQGNAILAEWLAKNKLIRPVKVLQSDRITTPVSIGIVNPCIILPKLMNTNDNQLMQYVLTHELQHLKRFDMLWKMVLILALCIHWFNPLVWVMFVLVNRDLEITCDESVVRHFGVNTKSTYALSLIGMAEQRSKFTPLCNGFSKNAAEERIVSIMKIKKTSFASILVACFLVFGVTTVFLTSEASAQTVSATTVSSSPNYVGEDAAKSAALNHAGVSEPEVTITKLEIFEKDGEMVYGIVFYTDTMKYSYEIYAVSGEVKVCYTKNAVNPQNYIGEDAARVIALNHAGVSESAISQPKIDLKEGNMLYKIEFVCGNVKYKYRIDVLTGDVLHSQSNKA